MHNAMPWLLFRALRTNSISPHDDNTHFFSSYFHLIHPFDFISDDVAVIVAIETAVADKIYVCTRANTFTYTEKKN